MIPWCSETLWLPGLSVSVSCIGSALNSIKSSLEGRLLIDWAAISESFFIVFFLLGRCVLGDDTDSGMVGSFVLAPLLFVFPAFALSRSRIHRVTLICCPTCKFVSSASKFCMAFVRTKDCSCWLVRDLLLRTRGLRGLKDFIIISVSDTLSTLRSVVAASSFKFHLLMNASIASW